MKKTVFLIFVGVFFLSFLSAQVETEYHIYQEKVLVKHAFGLPLENFELRIPKDADKFEINSAYEIENLEEYTLIKVQSASNLSVNYITKSMINKAGGKFYFTSRNYLSDKQNVKLVFPESAVLSESGLLFPEPNEITTDGRSIILKWEDFEENQIIVDYEFVSKRNFIFYVILLAVILAFSAYVLFQRKIFKKKLSKIKKKSSSKSKKQEKKSKDIEEHLVESEKAVISELRQSEKHQLWQKQLQIKTGFSKAKLSRVIRNLEARNLIQRVPMGNTNKIKLKLE